MKTSTVGNLTSLTKELESVFLRRCGSIPALAIAFTLEPDHDEVHWVTNVSRADGITLLTATAQKMTAQTN
jgi:hypothetical protein